MAGLVGVAFALVIGMGGSGSHDHHRAQAASAAANSSALAGVHGEALARAAGKHGASQLGAAASPLGAGAHAGHHAGGTSVSLGADGSATVAEVRDPEESKSFPLPASVRHKAASTPSRAAEAIVAPGAASDSEIRKELREEEHAKAEERALRTRALTADTSNGGSSVGGNGTVPIPTGVPEVVQRVIAGGNAIADFPYIWGGGHGSFVDHGYDCSGSVSYALAAGGLLSAPLVSGDLANWGAPGPGRWITIYANAGHTFMNVDGMWFDTAGRSGPYASRWILATPSLVGYAVRHPPGL